jgi:hypothetical protein
MSNGVHRSGRHKTLTFVLVSEFQTFSVGSASTGTGTCHFGCCTFSVVAILLRKWLLAVDECVLTLVLARYA